MKKVITTFAIAGLIVVSPEIPYQHSNISQAAIVKSVLLGERIVGDKVDHDTIAVTADKGTFRRIKFAARDHAIQIYRIVVHYGNGEPDKIEVKAVIPAGQESRVIDLKGGDRVIKKIDVWYETKSLGKQKAILRVYGVR